MSGLTSWSWNPNLPIGESLAGMLAVTDVTVPNRAPPVTRSRDTVKVSSTSTSSSSMMVMSIVASLLRQGKTNLVL
jgi:hypothetical protein